MACSWINVRTNYVELVFKYIDGDDVNVWKSIALIKLMRIIV